MSEPTSGAAPAALLLTGHETIGQVHLSGADGLAITCRGCRAMTCMPFKLLAHRYRVTVGHLVADVVMRLKCRRCRQRVSALSDVRPWRVREGQERRPAAAEKGES